MRLRAAFFTLLALGIGITPGAARPKLVIVISLDQFRYDYLTRFNAFFGKNGFNYLLRNGASFSGATYKHAMNSTGPGHTVILTGSYANQNGIIANNWFDRQEQRDVYCVSDKDVSMVGSRGEGRSPSNIIGSTLGDALRLHTSFKSKVVSVSIKDRAAIPLGGKLANAAYWMVDSVFVTSTFYARALPAWVQTFNRSGIINSYFNRMWDRVLPERACEEMDVDDAPYESGGNGLGRTFPHRVAGKDTTRITESYYWAMLDSPFGSEVLAAFAREALKNEQLGRGRTTDLFCISFSCNDHIGHAYGPNSHEVLDMTVRTDRLLADFFKFVDTYVGLKNCLIVLTSDHGVTPIPEFIKKQYPNADAGRIQGGTIRNACNDALNKAFGVPAAEKWVRKISGYNIYLNTDVLQQKRLAADLVASTLADSLMKIPQVAIAVARPKMLSGTPNTLIEQKMRRSFHLTRSGDVVYALKPYWLEGNDSTGTSHGLPYDHDAHVPLMIVGAGVRQGVYATEASPADIAPTLAALLGIEFPAGREGRVLVEALK